MFEPWVIGTIAVGVMGLLGLAGALLDSAGVKRMHGFLQVPLVAWTIVGAVTVMWSRSPTMFDQVMAVGLVGMTGLVGYLSPKDDDPGWAKAVHYLMGAVVLGWYAVMAHRFGGLAGIGGL